MGKYNNEKSQPPQKRKLTFILLLLIMILIATNATTAYFWQKAENVAENETEKNNTFNLLNPAREFIKQEDAIVNFQPLRDYLNGTYEADPNTSVYFEYLPTGSNIAISKDAQFYPASLLKVPIAMAVAKKIDKGEWRWDNKLVLMSTDKNDKFGTLYKEPTGSIFTIEDIVRRSVADSDNTANSILLRNLENYEINDVNAHIGLSGFIEANGRISAKRYSVIFRSLYGSSYLTDENSQKIISFLAEEKFREYLGSGFPENITFAHKIGIDVDKNVYLDSGIVYLENRPYILSVMAKSKTAEQAKDIMKDISEKVFNYVKNYKK